MIAEYIAIIGGWWIVGFAGFAFWWTASYDLTLKYAIGGLFPSLVLGPLAWPLGYLIHGDHTKPIVLIKKRGNK